ncbi:ABC transporter ATP-binding protein [Okibacterium endophyticum]
MTKSDVMLEATGLSVGFPTSSGEVSYATRDVSIAVSRGRTLGIVGESGSGKSVTLRALLGLVPYPGQVVSGSVRLEGRELLTLSPREWERIRGQEIAMVLQDPTTSLNPTFTVGHQLSETLRLKCGVKRARLTAAAAELLDQVGIRSPRQKLKAFPHELSGGMRQRVMIAMAVAARPRVLLADEPTTALDVTIQDQILSLLADLSAEMDMATVIVSHDLGVITQLCDDVAVMYAGRVIERGDVDEVLDRPEHPYTEALVRTHAELAEGPGVGGRSLLHALGGQPPLLAELPKGCSFAPRCEYAQPECGDFDMRVDRALGEHGTACLVRQNERDTA